MVRTVSTSVDFLATAGVGSWLEADLTVDRIGRRAVFTSCRVTSGDTVVARATAVLMRG
ncbi:Thioesterase superfamily protein [Amycolatopsis saalfeldensis]|uniref:Thioesterase superfamily protein n=1 Tax=Amycolatopsis saalfeldensis TaxID=394193 RepID=A0A1H8UTE3_9PSEU|nr:Thioesterase superfamily protein [Amycolatopsis saalfeldensis]